MAYSNRTVYVVLTNYTLFRCFITLWTHQCYDSPLPKRRTSRRVKLTSRYAAIALPLRTRSDTYMVSVLAFFFIVRSTGSLSMRRRFVPPVVLAGSRSLRHCAISFSSGSKPALCQERRRRPARDDSSEREVRSLPSMSVHAENASSASTDVA